MNFIDCIQSAVDAGKLSAAKGEEAKKAWQEAHDAFVAAGMNPEAAAVEAGPKALKEVSNIKAEQTTARLWEMERVHEYHTQMKASEKPWRVLLQIERSLLVSEEGIRGAVLKNVRELVNQFKPTKGGLEHPVEHLEDVVRGLFDEKTIDEVGGMVKGVKAALAYFDKQFKLYGINLGSGKDFHLPQKLDAHKVALMGREEFINMFMNKVNLDWDKMRYAGKLIPEAERPLRLGSMWDHIVADISNMGDQYGNIGSRLSRERFLIYKDAAGWLKANELLGQGNAYNQIMSHFHELSIDLAAVQHFGANASTIKNLIGQMAHDRAGELAIKNPAKSDSLKVRTKTAIEDFNQAYQIFTRTVPNNSDGWIAVAGGTVRTLLVAPKLVHTVITALTSDPMLLKSGLDFYGLSTKGVWRDYFKYLLSEDARQNAMQNGVLLDGYLSNAGMVMRDALVDGPVFGQRMIDIAMRSTGGLLHHSTMKVVGSRHWMLEMAKMGGKEFDKLPEDFRRGLDMWGITKEDWNVFRNEAKIKFQDGGEGLSPLKMAGDSSDRAKVEVANKFARHLNDTLAKGNPRPGLQTQVEWGRAVPANTARGQYLRIAGTLRSFGVEILLNHARDIMINGSFYDKVRLGGKFFVSLTMGGAMALQTRALLKGQDLYNMDPTTEAGRDFWGQAIIRGGGLGLIGDWLGAAYRNEADNGVLYATGKDMLQLSHELASQFTDDPKGHPTLTAMKVGADVAPIPWYVQFLFRLSVRDALMEEIDPAGYARMQQTAARNQRETGQGNWMQEGRSPDYAEAPQ